MEDAVVNIIQSTPKAIQAADPRHVLNILVQDEQGIVSRMSGILAARDFNIKSFVAGDTNIPGLSRITIVLNGDKAQVEQARRQLEDLVPVWAALDYTKTPLIQRELLLIRVSTLGREYVQQHLQSAVLEDNGQEEDDTEEMKMLDEPPSKILLKRSSHLRALTELTRLFDGKIADVSSDSVVLEVCGKSSRVTSFINLCKPFGILEVSRTGMMAMPRTPVVDQEMEDEEESKDTDVVDASMLPPG
ncbi:acetolactate synthase [Backusella circina FSU 941]|nr:acetolactate synthase [Backusella circina FSU 941]